MKNHNAKRVVVTGVGMVTSIGLGKDGFWENAIKGKSGISEVETFDTKNYGIHKGGEVKGLKAGDYLQKNYLKETARATQFVTIASILSIKDSGYTFKDLSGMRIPVIIGTTMGEGGMIEEVDKHWTISGEDDVWGITATKYPSNIISDSVSRYFKLKRSSDVISTACASGNYSIGLGYDLIRIGQSNIALVGGADPFSRIGFTGFNRLYAMAPDICRPFDKNRKGMMVGEGSGVLILEELNSALSRKANIYAEVLGYGLSCDAGHMTKPSVEGITKVMKKALKNSNITPQQVDYICAHGTGTPANDATECAAIETVFSDNYKKIAINSIKSMLGHTMGAASAIEAISCCLTIKNGIIPPTINYETPDSECDIDCVPNVAKEKKVRIALNNSLAFGGNNACLVLGEINGNE